VYHDLPRTLNELRTAINAYIRNISQADLQKVFANKIKRVQACIDARGHHFQHLLEVHRDFPNALYNIRKGKGKKGKFHPRTGHEGPEGE
jgi:hypothetical protein